MRPLTSFLLPLILLLAVFARHVRAEDFPVHIEVHPQPGASAAEIAEAKAVARSVTAHFAFLQLCDHIQPHPAWLDKNADIQFNVYPAAAKELRRPEFDPVRPTAKERGEFYVAYVYTRGDRKEKPLYLYLLVLHGDRADLVRAFELKHGRMEKTFG